MKKVFAGTFVAAAFAVGLSAQTPAPGQPMQDAKDAVKDAKSVTVTGCLKAGDTPETYLLSNLKWADKASGAVGTSGVVTPSAPVATAAALNIVGSPSGAKLSDHVGHTVELTGTVDKAIAGTTAPDAAKPASFSVKNLKMISATCPAQ
jgi:hypothetical protein